MSKPKPDVGASDQQGDQPVSAVVLVSKEIPDSIPGTFTTFRDTRYTSRTVVLSDGRTLAVAKGRVSVAIDDDVALKCLNHHAEFALLKE